MSLVDGSLGRRNLLLASDRGDRSRELEQILSMVGHVDVVSTSDMPEKPAKSLSGIVVDIDLRSTESVQRVRRKLGRGLYRLAFRTSDAAGNSASSRRMTIRIGPR